MLADARAAFKRPDIKRQVTDASVDQQISRPEILSDTVDAVIGRPPTTKQIVGRSLGACKPFIRPQSDKFRHHSIHDTMPEYASSPAAIP